MTLAPVGFGLDLDFDVDLDPFDWSAVAPVAPGAGGMTLSEPETVESLQHWYDLGFLGVTGEGDHFPEGFATTSTGELIAYWMGQQDAASGCPGQTFA